jgi:hypothetical protein
MKVNRQWTVVSIALVLLIGAVWYRQHSSPLHENAAMPASSSAITPRPIAVTHPSSTASKRGTANNHDAKDIEERETVVCGVGTVQVDPKDKAAPFHYVDRLTGIAQSHWRRSLLNSDDYHERAAGLLLQSTGWDYDPITGMPARTHDAQLARDELVQLAVGLDDLPIYAMALGACDPIDDGGVKGAACNQISLAKWADMDPDNAAPWLEMARAAHSQSDQAAELDAVNHAVQAHTVDFYNDSFLGFASSGMPSETTALQQAAFFRGRIGHVGGDGYAHSFVTSQYCTAAAVGSSSIHQQCEALAELLADHGRNTLDVSAAATIGTRLGWASERVSAMREEVLAMFRAENYSGKDPWSCDNVRALTEFASVQARSGEVAAARAAIQKSGKSISELAKEQTDSLRE